MDDLVMPSRGVTVEGRGAVTAAPDTARITAGIDVVKKDLATARAEAATLANAIISAVKARGIAPEEIRTSRFSVRVERDYSKGGQARITGYGVSNQITVIVRDLERIGGVLDDVVAAGANNVSGPEFFIERPEALEDEARRLAIADARRRAGVLAEAAGARIGDVDAILEAPMARPMPRAVRMSRMAETTLMADTPIESGTEEIAVEIQVRWTLTRPGAE